MPLLILVLLLIIAMPASAQVVINGKQLNVTTTSDKGVTLVPLRAIFQALGADVNWDGSTQTVTANKGLTTVKLKIGSNSAEVNANKVVLQVPGKVIDGNTMVPLRFVSEALGSKVSWDGVTKTITINSDSNTQPAVSNQGVTAKVTRVIDGDTIEVDLNGKTEKIRFIGVDTPETVHPTRGVESYGKEASDYTKKALSGKSVGLEFDVQERDNYGRVLAYVWLNNQLFNEVLVREGYAQVSTYPPNVKYVDRFTSAQQQAISSNKGLWSTGDVTPPVTATTGKYVGSKDSNKYHHPECRWAEKINAENKVWFVDASDAKSKNYEPCGVCKP